MFRRRLLMVAAVAATLWASSQAQASFVLQIDVYKTSGMSLVESITESTPAVGLGSETLTFSHINPSSSDFTSATLNQDLLLEVKADSNRTDPSGNPAQIQNVTATIRNVSAHTAVGNTNPATPYTVVISLTDTDFTIPVGPNPMTLTSVLQWSAAGNPAVTGSFQSAADTGNTEFAGGSVATIFTAAGTATPGSQTIGDTSSANTNKVIQFNRSGPYSLTNQYIINTSAQMTAAASLTGTTEVWAAPAPGGLILAATALPFVGLLRRRLRAAAPTA
jgi:hypothetical protein